MQKELIENAIERAKLFGILKYLPEGQLTHAPFSLSPFLISAYDLQEMTELTAPFSELMIGISQNWEFLEHHLEPIACLLYTSPSPRDLSTSRMPSSA